MSPMPTPESLTKNHTPSRTLGGDFIPVVKLEKAGETLVGIYQGRGQFKVNGEYKVSHTFKLSALSEGVAVMRSKQKIDAENGMLVSASGTLLDDNLTVENIGKTVSIKFVAKRTTARGGTPCNVFEIDVYDKELIPA